MTELKDQLLKFNMDKHFKEIIFQMIEKIATQELKLATQEDKIERLAQNQIKFA